MRCAAAALLLAGTAEAQQVTVKPIAEARARYERVAQDGLPETADAITVRLRAGVEATRGRWSALVEGEATVAPLGDYNDGLNGRIDTPVVADPRSLQLNRAQLRYAAGPGGLAVTAGRQRIDLLDQRFVASAPFRQNDQTFDAVRLQWGTPTGVAIDVSYAPRVLTVNGSRGRGARPEAISGDNLFAVAGLPTPIGRASAFAFHVDLDEAAVQGFRLSSRSYGVRLAGDRPIGGARLSYAVSWARQRDGGRNPNRYRAGYLLGEATLARAGVSGTIGYEELGADGGGPLTSFQAPLGALFKFQGWADKFVLTPPDGVRDVYAGVGYAARSAAPVTLSATWHRLGSDRLPRRYGTEWDLLATLKRGRTLFAVRYADYRADGFATDTRKLWVSADWVL